MAVASLISSYPMLPEFEKTIPKPLKKRYRDFFNGDHENPVVSNLENVPTNKLGKFAFVGGPGANDIGYPLHRYRKSVIKRSITQHISIIGQLSPMLNANSVNGLGKLQQELQDASSHELAEDERPEREESQRRFVYMAENYPTAVKFTGKLKVKWRQKYENLESGFREDDPEEFDDESKPKRETKTASSHQTAGSRRAKSVSMRKAVADEKTENADPATQPEPVRKLERTRKGLIYQEFMASSYPRNRKERTSSKNTIAASTVSAETQTAQPRKRGRPRLTEKCTQSSADVGPPKPSSITLMRLEGQKDDNSLGCTVVDSEKSKATSSYDKKRLSRLSSKSGCLRCGLTVVAASKSSKNTNKSGKFSCSDPVCRCYVADNFEIIIDDIEVKPPAKRRKLK